jgi:hypothetical protein
MAHIVVVAEPVQVAIRKSDYISGRERLGAFFI